MYIFAIYWFTSRTLNLRFNDSEGVYRVSLVQQKSVRAFLSNVTTKVSNDSTTTSPPDTSRAPKKSQIQNFKESNLSTVSQTKDNLLTVKHNLVSLCRCGCVSFWSKTARFLLMLWDHEDYKVAAGWSCWLPRFLFVCVCVNVSFKRAVSSCLIVKEKRKADDREKETSRSLRAPFLLCFEKLWDLTFFTNLL